MGIADVIHDSLYSTLEELFDPMSVTSEYVDDHKELILSWIRFNLHIIHRLDSIAPRRFPQHHCNVSCAKIIKAHAKKIYQEGIDGDLI